MLRSSWARLPAPVRGPRPRTLVSTVLLSKNWDTHSIADLKSEAKQRGLPQRGSRATLITRIKEHDQRSPLQPAHVPASREPPVPALVRNASAAPASSTPPPASSAPPPPSAPSPVAAFPSQSLDIHLPDLSAPYPELPVQIPFVPDFWDSFRVKAASAPPPPSEPPVPKILVVAGSATHPAGGPTFNLSSAVESLATADAPSASAPSASVTPATGVRSFWADVAGDLGVPTTLALPGAARAQQKALIESLPDEAASLGAQGGHHGRTLDADERKGVWVVLGVLAGSWLAGGLLSREAQFAEHAAVAEEAKHE